jgi:hypothetical protein
VIKKTEQVEAGGTPAGVLAAELPDAAASEITENDMPRITRDEPGHITFIWPNDQIIVDAQRFTDKGQAEITIWWDNPTQRLIVAQDRIDLLSPSSKRTFIGQLKNANNALQYIHWDWIVRCITWKVMDSIRKGPPVEEIWPVEGSILAPEYLVQPLLYLNHPTVIFGDYGSLKSTVALLIAFIAQLPYQNNGLGLITKDNPANTLYLDLEGDSPMFTKRWSALSRGFKIEAQMPILYRRMDAKVADSIDTIQQIVVENKIRFIIIDSLGPAVKGNLNEPEPAMDYNQALRKLGITSLTLAHNSKDPLTKQRSIFGSVFFSNLARSIWQCKVEGERQPDDDQAIISLKQIKASFSQLYGTLGYTFKFTDNSITVGKTDLKDTALAGELPLTWQIKNLLKGGAMQASEIADLTDKPINTIRVTLSRMKAKKEIHSLPDQKWGLAQEC